MTDSVWTQIPQGTEPSVASPPQDFGKWDVTAEDEPGPDDLRRRAVEYQERAAREMAQADFYNGIFGGGWSPKASLRGWEARYIKAYESEIERLEAERRAAMTGSPPAVAEE
jgi:hypothetical protein